MTPTVGQGFWLIWIVNKNNYLWLIGWYCSGLGKCKSISFIDLETLVRTGYTILSYTMLVCIYTFVKDYQERQCYGMVMGMGLFINLFYF